MELSLLVLCIINFLYIWALPWIFFKKDGKKNIRWFFTALPYMLAPFIPLAEYLGYLKPIYNPVGELALLQSILCTVMFSISVMLMSLTIGTHRIPVALWHQKHEDDAPEYLVTWGAYARIRHPFYTSFIIATFSMVILTLHLFALLIFVYVFLVMTITAKREENRLSNEKGGVGEEYSVYMTRTGRFFPRILTS